MAKIKSALELALERTEGFTVDKQKIKEKEIRTKGRLSASKLLETPKNQNLKEEYASYQKEEEHLWFKAGAMEVVLSNIRLPKSELDLKKIPLLAEIVGIIDGAPEDAQTLFTQVDQLLKQYLENIKDLEEKLKAHYAQQSGAQDPISAESNPEFMKLLEQQLKQLQEQYNGVLVQVKDKLTSTVQ